MGTARRDRAGRPRALCPLPPPGQARDPQGLGRGALPRSFLNSPDFPPAARVSGDWTRGLAELSSVSALMSWNAGGFFNPAVYPNQQLRAGRDGCHFPVIRALAGRPVFQETPLSPSSCRLAASSEALGRQPGTQVAAPDTGPWAGTGPPVELGCFGPHWCPVETVGRVPQGAAHRYGLRGRP